MARQAFLFEVVGPFLVQICVCMAGFSVNWFPPAYFCLGTSLPLVFEKVHSCLHDKSYLSRLCCICLAGFIM